MQHSGFFWVLLATNLGFASTSGFVSPPEVVSYPEEGFFHYHLHPDFPSVTKLIFGYEGTVVTLRYVRVSRKSMWPIYLEATFSARSSCHKPGFNNGKLQWSLMTNECLERNDAISHVQYPEDVLANETFHSCNRYEPKFHEVVLPADGAYILRIDSIEGSSQVNNWFRKNFVTDLTYSYPPLQIELEVQGEHGYLNLLDWPMMVLYGVLFGIYVVLHILWLKFDKPNWGKTRIRIPFMIALVILAGVLQYAFAFMEFFYVNTLGTATGIYLSAASEVMGSAKQSIAR